MHTLADPINHAVRVAPNALAAVCGDVRLTYAQMHERCCRLANAMTDAGMKRGDRIAIWAANSHQYLEYYQALPAAGFVIVPLNTRHAEAELRYALNDAGARMLLTDRDPGGLSECVERVISIPDEYESLLSAASPTTTLGAGTQEDDLAGLFYTGGTTGASKGVMLTHRNLIANTFHTIALVHPRRDSVYLVMAPLFHAAGSNTVLATVWTGGTQVVLPAFSPAATLDIIEREKVTDTLAVPTMVAAMAEVQLTEPRDTSSLRMLSHGGSPIASAVVRRAHQAFPRTELVHVYGATEAAPLATGLRDEQNLLNDDRISSCGQPLAGVSIRAINDDGEDCPVGEIGEIAIRGPNIMKGYWQKPEQTAEVLRNGWYHSGDLGYLDDSGFVYLVDRKKDMIISGGENVYSTEVEDALFKHEAVLEAAVFGIPHPQWGETVHAVVVPRHDVSDEELIAHCRTALAGYKVPRSISFQEEELPKSGPGKVLKRELREPFWRDAGGNIG